MQDKAILVVGAGDATGAAIAKRFAREGYIACLMRRDGAKLSALVEEIIAAGGRAVAFARDAREEEQVNSTIQEIEATIAPLAVCVFNIGANVPASILDETARKYRKIWELAAYSGFLVGRAAAAAMTARGGGTIIFTGASASLRGRAHFSAFAGGKHALRALAQSMARELGPKGVHVAHIVIDGAIDTDFIRQTFPDIYAGKDNDAILNPAHIAEHYWMIHNQPRDCWTFELDLRPWCENW